MDIELQLTTDTVDQAAPHRPLCVEPQTSIREVFTLLKDNGAGAVLVCSRGRLAGIFTERDALGVMQRRDDLDAPIETVMIPAPVVLRADASVASAILRMSSGGYRRVPLVDVKGQPLGILEVAGIVHYLVEHFPKTIYNLPPVAHPVIHDREGP
ncbi:MAG TPA: CBS domain-containing protein [Pirellulales bacterium]|nr:CBS domain-containing protein [Pirellulales bacterium]